MEAPGKRNDLHWRRPDQKPYTTPWRKRKEYTPVKSDKRDMGARKRSYKVNMPKKLEKIPQEIFLRAQSELNQLARGIYEDLETNYDKKHKKEELEILKNDVEIQQIIENLKRKGKQEKRMAKFKHNKKRNSAFLYEVLIQELTKSVLSKDQNRKLK